MHTYHVGIYIHSAEICTCTIHTYIYQPKLAINSNQCLLVYIVMMLYIKLCVRTCRGGGLRWRGKVWRRGKMFDRSPVSMTIHSSIWGNFLSSVKKMSSVRFEEENIENIIPRPLPPPPPKQPRYKNHRWNVYYFKKLLTISKQSSYNGIKHFRDIFMKR